MTASRSLERRLARLERACRGRQRVEYRILWLRENKDGELVYYDPRDPEVDVRKADVKVPGGAPGSADI